MDEVIDDGTHEERGMKSELSTEFAKYFRDKFRRARATALADAEAFDEIVVVVERLGVELAGLRNGLGGYEEAITEYAAASPMAFEIPGRRNELHPPFTDLFNAVRVRRNEAIHTGAVARHLTQHAIVLSLILEEAIMRNAGFRMVRDFMVTSPLCAASWQPLSFIRQNMLVNSFSFLPVKMTDEHKQEQWWIISDRSLAAYLRKPGGDQRSRLGQKLSKTLESKELKLEKPKIVDGGDDIETFISDLGPIPILVTEGTPTNLVGILTAHDLL